MKVWLNDKYADLKRLMNQGTVVNGGDERPQEPKPEIMGLARTLALLAK